MPEKLSLAGKKIETALAKILHPVVPSVPQALLNASGAVNRHYRTLVLRPITVSRHPQLRLYRGK